MNEINMKTDNKKIINLAWLVYIFIAISTLIIWANFVGIIVGSDETSKNIKCNPETLLFDNWVTGAGYLLTCKRK